MVETEWLSLPHPQKCHHCDLTVRWDGIQWVDSTSGQDDGFCFITSVIPPERNQRHLGTLPQIPDLRDPVAVMDWLD